ncbi:hypothetical protein [Mitsuaria sp. GD03876]|uniref:hypothetical protein n=1 Tax=Mitsuaria sp. GD03876 TaxID=2975399 RepID=UPI00244BBBB9|nr:hypothetical protein [Mitsuaria sp. GD03876]MDH0865906.1 hypothetical protein [Mitsuaria sp. GD03876]
MLSIWSLLDQSQWKTGDRVQVEIRVRLDALETFIETRLGDRYRSSDRGETLELALHRLVPEGNRFGRGFPLGDEGSADLLEEALITHGLPFANRVATGQLLLDDERLNPKWIAPMPWAVRRVLYRLATDPRASPVRLIQAELGHLEADLRTKWEAIAQFTRGMDVDVQVNERLQAFSAFADKVSNDKAFLIDLRAQVG